jgi:flagellar hook-associated protein 3 FlgL
MRVSTLQVAENSLFNITNAYSRLADAQSEVGTGLQLQQPSDNPVGTAQVLGYQAQSAMITQYNSNMDQANGFLSTSSSALSNLTNLVQQARTYALQGASQNNSQQTLEGLATQVQDIINQVGNIGNSTYGSRYVFAGQRTTTPPLVANGNGFNYAGGSVATNDAAVNVAVGNGQSMQINVSGDQVFTPLLSALGQLRDDLASGASSTLSRTDVANLDTQLNNIEAVNADMGSKIQQITQNQQRNQLTLTNLTQFVSNIQDADMPKAIVGLQTAQTAYQAAAEATAYSFQTSLLNFLSLA